MIESISELDEIYALLNDGRRKQGLVNLYRLSQIEHTHDGKISPEIGCARECDLKAVLQECIGERFKCNVASNKDNGADCIMNDKLISIKHISSKLGKGTPKAKWTSDETKAKEYVAQMLLLNPLNYTNMLIVHIDVHGKRATNTVTITCISSTQVMSAVEMLQGEAFKLSSGTNCRGVEYSKKMMDEMMKRKYFQIEIPDVVLHGGMDPIERRISELKRLYATLV
jgi:hypothetical protein